MVTTGAPPSMIKDLMLDKEPAAPGAASETSALLPATS